MQATGFSAGVLLTGLVAGLAACVSAEGPESAPRKLSYQDTDVTLMGGDLVLVQVAMEGAVRPDDLADYARCTAAGFAQGHRAGFVRHVRTNTKERGGVWHADAVYSITRALPEGEQTIDAEVTVADCQERGIPTGLGGRG